MQLIRGLCFDQNMAGCALTIGNFDGLHLGHQSLIKEVVRIARARKIPSVLMTFEPHPNEFFAKKSAVRLMSFRAKCQYLSEWGIDYLLCVRFNRKFSEMSALDFVQELLIQKLGVQALVIGDDFRFGAGRLGDVSLLQEFSKSLKFSLSQMPSLFIEGERVSSTGIRQALAEGNLKRVEQFLGRSYSILGRVSYGAQRGRELGYPTANIVIPRNKPAISGVFAVQVKGLSDAPLPGVACLGTRPMFDAGRYILEVHIFDFNETIYGHLIEVEFLEKLRDEKVFGSPEELMAQMDEDARQAGKKGGGRRPPRNKNPRA